MKIAVIGGGGVRTPLLVNGLIRSELRIDEIALFDIDPVRLATMASVAAAAARSVRTYDDAARCVSGASFVFLSIRSGGIAARAHDERAAVAHGIVGQETIGPAGFAMAMRNAPHAVEYARLIAREAPRAWIINFTNPVGIVTQAVMQSTGAPVIGICDTPTELFADVAHVLDVDPSRCYFDYFGLNHLGWLREVYVGREPQLPRLWAREDLLARVYRAPLFDAALLQSLRLLPSEYLFFYYSPDTALENLRKAGQTRGGAIAHLSDQLFRDLAAPGSDCRLVYDRYLSARSASYLQIESGSIGPPAASPWAELSGYDKIAVDVVRAIDGNRHAIIPLNVANRSAIRDLDNDEVVEVPCVVDSNGAHPLSAGSLPDSVRGLLLRMKEYEHLTVKAATTRSIEDAVRALAANPLVEREPLARVLIEALQLS